MIKILLTIVVLYSSSYALFNKERYINGEYTNNLKIIWMNKSKDKLQKKFSKALNHAGNKLQNKFDTISTQTKKKYEDIISILKDQTIYTDKEKLFFGTSDLIDSKLNDQLVVAFKLEKDEDNNYRLFGLKLFKDGKFTNATIYEVNKKTSNITQKDLENMIEFFILSSMNDYDQYKRTGSNSIITFADVAEEQLQINTYKNLFVRKFTTYIENQDIELAQKNKIIPSGKIDVYIAQKYCETIGMSLINKNLIKKNSDDEYSYEQLFEKYSFKDGWEVQKKQNHFIKDEKKFRCVDSKKSAISFSLQEYEQNQLGIKYRINNKKIEHQHQISGISIQSEESATGADVIYIAMIDTAGVLSIWEDDNLVSRKNTNLHNIQKIELSSDISSITIENLTTKETWAQKDGVLEKKDTNTTNNYIKKGLYTIAQANKSGYNASIDANSVLTINRKKNQLNYWPMSLAIGNNQVTIGSTDKLTTYNINEKDNTIKEKQAVEHTGVKGNVIKIVYFNDDKYLVAGTTTSQILIYKKGEPIPIKTISNFGYSINDIAISNNNKFLIASNGDLTVYIFDLDIILNSVETIQEDK